MQTEPQKQAPKAGNVKWHTSTVRISGCYHPAEVLLRKSTARISLVSTCQSPVSCHLRNSSSGGNSAAEIHSENFPSINLLSSQQYHPLKFLPGENSAAEIHSENFCLFTCSPGDVVINHSSSGSLNWSSSQLIIIFSTYQLKQSCEKNHTCSRCASTHCALDFLRS